MLLVKGTAVAGASGEASLIRTDIVLQVGIDHATTVAGFGSSSLLLYLAVTLGTQRGRVTAERLTYQTSRNAAEARPTAPGAGTGHSLGHEPFGSLLSTSEPHIVPWHERGILMPWQECV